MVSSLKESRFDQMKLISPSRFSDDMLNESIIEFGIFFNNKAALVEFLNSSYHLDTLDAYSGLSQPPVLWTFLFFTIISCLGGPFTLVVINNTIQTAKFDLLIYEVLSGSLLLLFNIFHFVYNIFFCIR